MKKSFGILGSIGLVFTVAATAPSQGQQEISTFVENDNEYNNLPKLGEPCRYVSGAYFGFGGTVSDIKHKVTVRKGNNPQDVSASKSKAQFDLSMISGFGAAFYNEYYAGIEFEFFKRFKRSSSRENEIEVMFTSNIGLNMDVRFGRQLPRYGALIYTTAGFARVIGEATFYSNNDYAKRSFGSFYPNFGFGVEKKINNDWNVRGDFRFAISSKDDNKETRMNGVIWKYEGKPNKTSFRISVTKNI